MFDKVDIEYNIPWDIFLAQIQKEIDIQMYLSA